METRMQRNKRLKKTKWKKKYKRIIILLAVLFMIIGIMVVNAEIKRKDFLENSNLFKISIKERTFDVLGKKYYVDLNILKESLFRIKNIL